MLGLIILSVIVCYVLFAHFMIKRLSSKRVKYIALAIFILIPTWDVIIGRIYFNWLCMSEGGISVYKTVELGKEYWNKEGNPIFFTEKGDLIEESLPGFKVDAESDTHYSHILRIHKRSLKVIERSSGRLLGERIRFAYFGGWLKNNMGIHVSAKSCPPYDEVSMNKLINEIFSPVIEK